MSGHALSQKQRNILHHRLARALLWEQAAVASQQYASRLATVVLDEMEKSAFSAATQRRAVQNIIARIDDVA